MGQEPHASISFLGSPGDPLQRIEADDKLCRGDLSPVDEAAQKRDLPRLWHFFEWALFTQYYPVPASAGGTTSTGAVLNQAIMERAASGLRQIPGHAKMLGDGVETLSRAPVANTAEGAMKQAFITLGELGSPEAIQQIARFLHDERELHVEPVRVPSADPASQLGGCGTLAPHHPNKSHAATALHVALGEKSPLLGKVPPKSMVLHEETKEMQRWWRSWSSRSYRKALPGVELPEWRPIAGRHPLPAWHVQHEEELMTALIWGGLALFFAGLIWWSRSLRAPAPLLRKRSA